ncbi:MAG TPA: SIR2 family protein [Pseudorhodoplanes sp.]|nr:SIR2 family protein [Pseudorhodoplanes sp.]
MQLIKGGPDIPEGLLQAHEDDRVVFFCGAGISYPAGLPGFKGLVKKLYAAIGTTPTSPEQSAIKSQQYDTAIGLLEARVVGGRQAVRQRIADILTPDLSLPRAIETHKALLTLSKNRKGQYRLITTNFDRIFEHVITSLSLSVPRCQAPMLPVPKSRWSELIYLHGLLPDKPNTSQLDALVVSSGDFGLAYLVERWAARFVSDLFRNYTVCFVGYSINDPVLRYMMDALAADRMRGEKPTEVFAFGSYSKGHKADASAAWEAKNVTPILYQEHRRHWYLHQTLRAWSDTYRDGILGKERIIVDYASVRPLPSTEQEDPIGRVLWALADPTGLPAKRFAELDPPRSLDWLDALSEQRFRHADLPRFGVQPDREENKALAFSFINRPTPYSRSPSMSIVELSGSAWDDVMLQLGYWLARHLNDPKLLHWITSRGGRLHPTFKMIIEQEIKKNPLPKTMMTLWRLVLSDRVTGRP